MPNKKHICIILLTFCFIFFLIIYKHTLYTPPLFDSGKRNFIDKTFDFFCFGWHHFRASTYQKYFHNKQKAAREFAQAGWYRERYLVRKFRIHEADIGSIINFYRESKLESILEKIFINAIKSNTLESNMLGEAGLLFMKRENWDMALKVYSEMLGQNLNDPINHYYLGLIYLKLKRWRKAVNSFELVVELNPEFADAYYQMGYIAERENNLTKAMQLYQKTISILPNHLDSLKAFKRLYMALEDSL